MSLVQFIAIMVAFQAPVDRTPVEFTKDSLAVVKENVAKKKAVLVDVRGLSEWKKGNIEGAIFLPVDSLNKKTDPKELTKVLPKDKILYTFCVVGMRAKTAAKKLEQYGYTVRALKPGYDDLIKAGFKKAEPKATNEGAAASDANSRQRNAE